MRVSTNIIYICHLSRFINLTYYLRSRFKCRTKCTVVVQNACTAHATFLGLEGVFYFIYLCFNIIKVTTKMHNFRYLTFLCVDYQSITNSTHQFPYKKPTHQLEVIFMFGCPYGFEQLHQIRK